MKAIIIILTLVFFISPLSYHLALAEDTRGKSETGTTSALLQTNDIPNIKIEGIKPRLWWKGSNAEGKPDEIKGVEQYTTFQSVKALILYAEFENDEAAHQAANFYSKNMASIFLPGIWNGAVTKTIGDESWYALDALTIALLFRSGRTCILISCHDGDAKKRSNAVEMIGKRIADKVQAGGHVIVPDDDRKINQGASEGHSGVRPENSKYG